MDVSFWVAWAMAATILSYTPLFKPLHSPSKFTAGKPDGGQRQTQNQQLHVDSPPIPQVSPQHNHLLNTLSLIHITEPTRLLTIA